MPRKAITQDLASATVRYLRINADQTTSELSLAQLQADLAATPAAVAGTTGTFSGALTGATVNGLTISNYNNTGGGAFRHGNITNGAGAAGAVAVNGNGAHAGGFLNAAAGSGGAGGSLLMHGGSTAGGGSIDTQDGGGSIATTGTGSIQLGVAATRSTLRGNGTGTGFLDLPDPASGTITILGTGPQTLTADAQAQVRTNIGAASSAATPAFYAKVQGALALTNADFTRITSTTEIYDTTGAYASDRFTPQTAGYYKIGAFCEPNTSVTRLAIVIYKNGSAAQRICDFGSTFAGNGTGIVYCNGSTDYIDLYVYQAGATTTNSGAETQTYWFGELV